MFAAGNYSTLSEINIWANEALKLQCGDPVTRNKYHLGATKSLRREFLMTWCGRGWNNICWYIEIEKNDRHFTDDILKYFSETKFLIEIAQKIIIVALYTMYPIEYAHDDVIKWKNLPRYWPLVRGIHWSPVNSPHKGQWRGSLMFSFIYAWTYDWVNNREAGELRRHRGHYDVTVMHLFVSLAYCAYIRS